jgi:hypothetical protein
MSELSGEGGECGVGYGGAFEGGESRVEGEGWGA